MDEDFYNDPLWHQAVMMHESNGQNFSGDGSLLQGPNVPGQGTAKGSMQVMDATNLDPGFGVTPAKDDSADERKRVGNDYLVAMGKRYKHPDLALMAYDWGPGNVDKWLANGAKLNEIPDETQQYIPDVNKRYAKLKGDTTATMTQSPAGFETTQADPIMDALSEKEVSAAPVDPISAALTDGEVQGPTQPKATENKSPTMSDYALDTLKSVPGAVARGVGAIPQIPLYAGNMAARLMGQSWGAAHDLFSDTPYSKEQHEKLANVSPFYTGTTIADTLTKAGAGLTEGIGGDNLSAEQKGRLHQLEQNGLIDNEIYNPKYLPGKLVSAGIQGGVSGPAVGAGPLISAFSGASGELANEKYPNNPLATLLAGGVPFGVKGAYNFGADLVGKGAQANESFPVSKVFEAAQRDLGPNATEADVRAAVDKLGPNAFVADIGPNSRDLGYVTGQTPGRGQEIAQTALEGRQAGQADRIVQAASKGLNVNPGDTYNKVLAKLDEKQQTNASPLYKQAFEANKNVSDPVVNRILDTDAGKAALNFARNRMNNRMALMGEPDPELAEQAKLTGQYQSGGISSGLKLETLDLVKQGFDDQISSLQRKGESGAARDLIGLKKGLVNRLDEVDKTGYDARGNALATGGVYKQARSSYAEPAQQKEALDSGYDYVGKKGNADPDIVKDLSPAQKQFFKLGAANRLQEMIQDTRFGRDASKNVLISPAQEKALSSLFDSPKEFQDFKDSVAHEAEYFRTRHQVLGNSLTDPRMAAREDAELTPTQRALKTGVGGLKHTTEFALRNWPGKFAYAGQLLYNNLTKPKRITPETAEKMANMQFSPKGADDFVDSYKKYLMNQLNNSKNSLTFPGAQNLTINSQTRP